MGRHRNPRRAAYGKPRGTGHAHPSRTGATVGGRVTRRTTHTGRNPGHIDGTAYNYTLPMVIFASCGVVAMLLGIWLKAEDRRKHYGLELPNIKK